MKLSKFVLQSIFCASMFAGLLILSGQNVNAAEPVQRFLSRLRDLDMNDVAIDYLEILKTQPGISDDVKASIPYEQGICLLESSSSIRNIDQRFAALDRATQLFTDFVQKNPKHTKKAGAQVQLGQVLAQRAEANMALSKRPTNKDKKPELLKKARELFQQAQAAFATSIKDLDAELARYPKFIDERKDAKQFAARAEIRQMYLQAKLYEATVWYQWAKAYNPKVETQKKQFQDKLTKSSELFGAGFERWRSLIVGMYFRYYQARSTYELGAAGIDKAGNFKKAMSYLTEIMLQPADDPSVSEVRAKAIVIAQEIWFNDKKYAESIKAGDEWIDNARGTQERSSEAASIRNNLFLAITEALKTEKDAKLIRKYKADMKKHARALTTFDNEYRADMLKYLNGAGGSEGPATNFKDAYAEAAQILETLKVIEADLKKANSPAEKKEGQKKVDEAVDKAYKSLHYALTLKEVPAEGEESVDTDSVNSARYYLSYMYYRKGQFYEAGLLGEFIADKFPEASSAKGASNIALAAYSQAYNRADAKTNGFERGLMENVAELIVDTWPSSDEANRARTQLVSFKLSKKDFDGMEEILKGIPEGSADRTQAMLKAGHAYWGHYLRLSASNVGLDPADQKDYSKFLKRAEELLSKGVENALADAAGSPSLSFLTGQLSLLQLYSRTNRYADAKKLMETEKSGLLALSTDPITETGNLREQTFKVGLRTYVGLREQDKAEKMMDSLDALFKAGGDKDAQSKLTKTFVMLGRELKEDLDRITDATEKEGIEKSFVSFLNRISSRSDSASFPTLVWVADTFYSLADSGSADAASYYQTATSTYESILNNAKKDPSWLPDPKEKHAAHILRTKAQLARSYTGAKKFESAEKIYKGILTANPMTLEVQKEIGDMYYKWGQAKKDYKIAYKAMTGEKDPENPRKYIVWGWAYMGKLLQKKAYGKDFSPVYRQHFHDSRYKLAEGYYIVANLQKDQTKRMEFLGKAKTNIEFTARIASDMGGPTMLPKYKSLHKKILSELNDKTSKSLTEILGPPKTAGT